jgi:hypothetical protein
MSDKQFAKYYKQFYNKLGNKMTHIQKISNVLIQELGAKDAKIMQSWITKLLVINNKPATNTYELRITFKTKKSIENKKIESIETQAIDESISKKTQTKKNTKSKEEVKKAVKNKIKNKE